MNLYIPLIGIILIMLGVLIFLKTDKWVTITVDMWIFRDFTDFEIKLMKVMWRIGAMIFIVCGVWIIGKYMSYTT